MKMLHYNVTNTCIKTVGNVILVYSSQLEREIGDAEILLQKKEEIWAVRSNEQELAYEKELLYSPNGHPFLSQVKTCSFFILIKGI